MSDSLFDIDRVLDDGPLRLVFKTIAGVEREASLVVLVRHTDSSGESEALRIRMPYDKAAILFDSLQDLNVQQRVDEGQPYNRPYYKTLRSFLMNQGCMAEASQLAEGLEAAKRTNYSAPGAAYT